MLAQWIEQTLQALGYPGIALLMLLETVFPPIPSELIMPLAGFWSTQGTLDVVGVFLAGTLGSSTGALLLYYVGRWADEPVVRRLVRRYGRYMGLTEPDLDRGLGLISRYGQPIVFFGRLVPIVRSLVSLPAGMSRMPMPTFALLTLLGSALWNAILTGGGYILGEQWELILHYVKQYEHLVLALGVVAVVAFLVWRLVYSRRSQPEPRA